MVDLTNYRRVDVWKAYENDGRITYAILGPDDIVAYGMVWRPKNG